MFNLLPSKVKFGSPTREVDEPKVETLLSVAPVAEEIAVDSSDSCVGVTDIDSIALSIEL